MSPCRLWIVAAALALVAGCASSPPPPPPVVPGYDQLVLAVGDRDFTPLRGRRILLDPGHGGKFRGAIGPGGLAEADVNLGVALYLRGLLEWAGATVFMTRTADNDLLTPSDSTLAGDLAARVAMADSLRPDVFVSIHHNSTADRDPTANETQTYYPTGREGADLDLARCIHEHLVEALSIEPARIMAGNFHVLRAAPVPAVLGEPAMISNPVIEGRLSLAASHELEAKAYFLGLLEYFAGGAPRLVSAFADTLDLAQQGLVPLRWAYSPGREGDPALDPATLELSLDGRREEVALSASGDTISWRPAAPLTAGDHRFVLRARNTRGRAAPDVTGVLGWHPASCTVTCRREASGGRALVRIDASDPDLAARRLRLGAGGPAAALTDVRGGRAYLWHDGAVASASVVTKDGATVAEARVENAVLPAPWRWRPLLAPRATWPDVFVPGGVWRARAAGPLAQLDPRLLGADEPVIADHPDHPLWLEADGALPLVTDVQGCSPWSSAPADTLVWQPLLPAMIGKRIVIDPRGGGSDEQGRGPLGTRGSDLNLAIAQRLAALLRGAGCEVTLTRTAETWWPDEIKVARANDAQADLYLALARGDTAGVITARHHPTSATGRALAERLAEICGARPREGWDYVLRHTACPALVVDLEPVASDERRLATPAAEDARARSLLLGIADLWQGDVVRREAVDLAQLMATIADPRMLPAASLDWARWDGNFSWLPISLPLPACGARHTLELHAGARWQLWACERQEGGAWLAKLLLEGP